MPAGLNDWTSSAHIARHATMATWPSIRRAYILRRESIMRNQTAAARRVDSTRTATAKAATRARRAARNLKVSAR